VEKNLKKEQVQNEAMQVWLDNEKMGTIELATGMGKTFTAFKAILTMPKGSNVLFLAETTVREATVLEDARKYKEFYGINPLENYHFKFACYQAAYKYSIWDYFSNTTQENTIIIFDEIHDCLSTEYFKFIQNSKLDENLIPRMGLSATIDRKTIYEIQEQEITKFDLLQTFCPVVYTYSLQESIENKTTRDIKFIVYQHKLEALEKNIHIKTKEYDFHTTELASYAKLEKDFREVMFLPTKTPQAKKAKEFRIIQTATRRARFLYSLPSKIKFAKRLLLELPGKTLVFGQDSKTLLELCKTSIVSQNKNYIKDLDNFKKGLTKLTCSNKILKQGENIPHLDNIVLFAYYSKVKDWSQMIGEKLAYIYLIR